MTPADLALREAHLNAARRALASAEADLKAAGRGMDSMRVGAVLRGLK